MTPSTRLTKQEIWQKFTFEFTSTGQMVEQVHDDVSPGTNWHSLHSCIREEPLEALDTNGC